MPLPDRARLAALANRYAPVLRRYLPVLVVLLAGAGIGVAVTTSDNDGDGHIDHATVAVTTPKGTATVVLGGASKPTATVALTPATKAAVTPKAGELVPDIPGGPPLADTTPAVPGVEADEQEQAKADNAARADDQTYDTSGVLQGGTAEPAHLTCHTPGHGAARAISAIRLGIVHVTVSKNVAGLADVAGLCNYFKGQKLSATWIVDNEGNSAENEPLNVTPWTQAFYNTYSCSIEFVGYTGRPGEGASSWTDVQYREGARLMAGCFKRAGIPAQNGDVTAGGHIQRAGIISHQELGILGGGHSDPGPNFDRARFLALVKAYVSTGTAYVATGVDKVTCRKLNWWRQAGRPHGKPEENAVRRRKALSARGVTCTVRGPLRA